MPITLIRTETDIVLPTRPIFLKTRLCLLMFVGYAIMGAWVPVFTLHLKSLNFTPDQMAWASSSIAIATFFAPLFWGQIADRWMAMERCMSLCALATCVLLCALSVSTEPLPTILVCILMWFFLVPIMSLTSSFSFRQLSRPEREYGKIRLWGTLGWMAASWCLSLWFLLLTWWSPDIVDVQKDWGDSIRLGALAAAVLTVYALTLPHTPPQPLGAVRGRSGLLCLVDAPLSALRLFRDRNFVVYTLCMFGLYMTVPFTTQLNPLMLDRHEVPSDLVPFCLTIAQSTEVLLLALLPVLLERLGMRTTMLVGASCWTVGLILLSIGSPLPLVLCALGSHGIFICCFLIAGQVFVNYQATHDIRASAQGLFQFINGSGLFLGHLMVGWVRDWTGDSFSQAYAMAAAMAGVIVMVFFAGFAPLRIAISGKESLVSDTESP